MCTTRRMGFILPHSFCEDSVRGLSALIQTQDGTGARQRESCSAHRSQAAESGGRSLGGSYTPRRRPQRHTTNQRHLPTARQLHNSLTDEPAMQSPCKHTRLLREILNLNYNKRCVENWTYTSKTKQKKTRQLYHLQKLTQNGLKTKV